VHKTCTPAFKQEKTLAIARVFRILAGAEGLEPSARGFGVLEFSFDNFK